MNREMILRVADAIEAAAKLDAKPEVGFDMTCYVNFDAKEDGSDRTGHSCGTTACIAGWAMLLNGDDLHHVEDMSNYEATDRGAELLGLNTGDADHLFTIVDDSLELEDVTPLQAVAVLRHLAETGKVDWSVATETLA